MNKLDEKLAMDGLKQYDAAAEMIDYYLDPERPFKLRPSHLLGLQRIALEGLSVYAGNFRPAPIEIGGVGISRLTLMLYLS